METTNTIVDYYTFKEQNITYNGLQEAAEKAQDYIVHGYQAQHTISEIIKNMPMLENLGYTLHPHSFAYALNRMLDDLPENALKRQFVADINKMDDLGLFCVNKGSTQIVLTQDYIVNYCNFEVINNFLYLDVKPKFELSIPTPETTTLIPTDDTYITLPAKDPEPDHPSGFGTEISFDDHNKKILLCTVIVFIGIRAIAYYYKDDSEKSSENTQDEALNSAYETVYLDLTLLTNILVSVIPLSVVILYKLRYYYFYKYFYYLLDIYNKKEKND